MSKVKYIIRFQGFYYAITGFWAIVNLDHFSRITNHTGDPFEMYSIAGLAFVLGLFFVWTSTKKEMLFPVGLLVLGSAIAVIIPEWIYLPHIGSPTLFWVDFVEEIVVVLLLVVFLFLPKFSSSPR